MSANVSIKSMLAVASVGAVMLFAGCSSKSTLEEAVPASTTLSITASPTSVNSGGTSVIEATVMASGSAVVGQSVTFAVSPSSAGYFTPADTITDASGVAAAVFTATSTGAATVTATIAGSSVSGNVALSVSSTGGGSSTGNVTMTASRSLLLANNADTSLITIVVRDALGQPAPDSTIVQLIAGEKFVDVDSNGLWSAGIDSLVFDANANGQWDALGSITANVYTTGGTGTATTNYVSGGNALTVYIKATINDNGITGNGELSLQLNPDAAVSSIYLSTDSMQLSVKQTGGIETGNVYATAYDANGNTVPEGISVSFVITSGPGGGEHLANVGYGPFVTTTNGQGVATVTIQSGTISGSVRIRATSDTVLSEATQVLISAGPPKYIVVGSEYCNVPYWDNVGDLVGIIAVVSDTFLNPVNDSTVVYFSTEEGTMRSHEKRTEDNMGIATSKWIAGTNVPTANGRVWIYAETAGGTVLDSSMFYNTHIANTLSISGWLTSILADGSDNFSVWVGAVDLNNNPVIGGTPFDGEARYLSVTGGTFEDGCNSSTGRTKVTSKVLKKDHSRNGSTDDGVGAIDAVTYTAAGGATITAVCSLLTDRAFASLSSIDGQGNTGPSEPVALTVNIVDRYGNPLADHTIAMTASGGTVNGGGPNTRETDEFGQAMGFTWSAPGLGTYTITATDNDPLGGIVLTMRITVE